MFLDRFIDSNLKHDSEQLYRARVLVALALTYIITLSLVALYMLSAEPLSASQAIWTLLVILLLNGLCAGVLWVLKARGQHQFCAHAICGLATLSSFSGIIISGGPISSPATPACVVAIILAFVVSGKRMGLIWAAIVIGLHAALLGVAHVGVQFPVWMGEQYFELNYIASWIATYLSIIGMMMIFDLINTRLKRERDAERARFEYLASHDPLTQLANRHVFDDHLRIAVARARRYQHSVALFFIDLNGFKPINDKYGHEMGDRVLQVVAARLHTHFRNIDTVARLGGDEFAIIIEDLRDEKSVVMLAQKIVKLLSDPVESLPPEIRLGGSIGIALCPQHAQDEEKLVHFADTAMYQAKRNCDNYRIFDPSMLGSPQL